MSKRILLTTAAILLGSLSLPVFAADTSAPAVTPTGGDPVVAKVNGQEIHRSSVLAEMQALGPQAQQIPPQMLYPQLLDKMIVTKLVSDKGYADKLQNDPEVKNQVKQAEQQFVAEAYVRKTVMPKISDDKIKAKYDELAKQYKPEDEVRARHILIKVDKDTPADKAEAKAEDLIKQLKGGADFATLAEQNSDDKGSAKQGGDLGYFPKNAMVKPFADAAFSMKAGDISDKPIKTDFGYHVIKVEDKRKSSPPPLSEVHDQIANKLGQEMTEQLVKSIKSSATIEKFNLDGSPMKTASDSSAPSTSK